MHHKPFSAHTHTPRPLPRSGRAQSLTAQHTRMGRLRRVDAAPIQNPCQQHASRRDAATDRQSRRCRTASRGGRSRQATRTPSPRSAPRLTDVRADPESCRLSPRLAPSIRIGRGHCAASMRSERQADAVVAPASPTGERRGRSRTISGGHRGRSRRWDPRVSSVDLAAEHDESAVSLACRQTAVFTNLLARRPSSPAAQHYGCRSVDEWSGTRSFVTPSATHQHSMPCPVDSSFSILAAV
jgi:hypothetical protein